MRLNATMIFDGVADDPAVTEPAIPSSGLLITSKLLLWPPRTQFPDALLRALNLFSERNVGLL
jgi:hypothetical protein